MADPLAPYVELSHADAVAQWRRVAARQAAGERQERFLPVEVLLSYGLFRLLDPHRFGGRNIHLVPPEVSTLAATMRRTPGSITSKMLNLEGARKNAGALEPLLYLRLARDEDLFDRQYVVALQAARAAGLGPAEVPDFLGLIGEQAADGLLGQDELGDAEIQRAVADEHEEVAELEQALKLPERDTTRIVEQRVRLGQHRFARAVLSTFHRRCGFCGFSPAQLQRPRLLVASHIKPWKSSSSAERLDPRNGVAACPMHDIAFDTGLLAVSPDLRIVRSVRLDRATQTDEVTARLLGQPLVRDSLLLPEGARTPDPRYLQFHLENIFLARAQ